MVQIQGSAVVVTGGQRGPGRALVQQLLQHGAAKVHATARRPVSDPGPRAAAADVGDPASIAPLAGLAGNRLITFAGRGRRQRPITRHHFLAHLAAGVAGVPSPVTGVKR